MRDGAPEQFSSAVRDVHNNIHHDRWIGRGGHCMASTLASFETSGFLLMGAPKIAYVCSSC
jgi:hypothetical protein